MIGVVLPWMVLGNCRNAGSHPNAGCERQNGKTMQTPIHETFPKHSDHLFQLDGALDIEREADPVEPF